MFLYIGSFAYLPTYCKYFCGHAALTENAQGRSASLKSALWPPRKSDQTPVFAVDSFCLLTAPSNVGTQSAVVRNQRRRPKKSRLFVLSWHDFASHNMTLAPHPVNRINMINNQINRNSVRWRVLGLFLGCRSQILAIGSPLYFQWVTGANNLVDDPVQRAPHKTRYKTTSPGRKLLNLKANRWR
jgi:hypothetical protein